MRIIVTGGRDYKDEATVTRVLTAINRDAELVHGHCPTGADKLADDLWAWYGYWVPERHPADWNLFGKAAGPLRNGEMADLGADICIAFPGGHGTEDMVSKAKHAGIPVLRVETA